MTPPEEKSMLPRLGVVAVSVYFYFSVSGPRQANAGSRDLAIFLLLLFRRFRRE